MTWIRSVSSLKATSPAGPVPSIRHETFRESYGGSRLVIQGKPATPGAALRVLSALDTRRRRRRAGRRARGACQRSGKSRQQRECTMPVSFDVPGSPGPYPSNAGHGAPCPRRVRRVLDHLPSGLGVPIEMARHLGNYASSDFEQPLFRLADTQTRNPGLQAGGTMENAADHCGLNSRLTLDCPRLPDRARGVHSHRSATRSSRPRGDGQRPPPAVPPPQSRRTTTSMDEEIAACAISRAAP
jgi:hypothetical protein